MFKDIRSGNPTQLRLLAVVPGGREVEQELHARFSHLRRRGEWFDRAPELLAEIERLANPIWRPEADEAKNG
jgi:hypothetical protein